MIRKPKGYWTKERVVMELRAQSKKLGHSLSIKEVQSSSLPVIAVNLFGSWNNAKTAAGLELWVRPNRKESEEKFWEVFVKPMTKIEIAQKLGWLKTKVNDYIQRLRKRGLVQKVKFSLEHGYAGRSSAKFGAHELFDGLSFPFHAVIFYNPHSLLHKKILFEMVKQAIPSRITKGMRCSLTHHLRRILPPELHDDVRKLLTERMKEVGEGNSSY